MVRRIEGIDSAAEVMRAPLSSLLPVSPTLVKQMSVFARRSDVRRAFDENSLSCVVFDSRELGECCTHVITTRS